MYNHKSLLEYWEDDTSSVCVFMRFIRFKRDASYIMPERGSIVLGSKDWLVKESLRHSRTISKLSLTFRSSHGHKKVKFLALLYPYG